MAARRALWGSCQGIWSKETSLISVEESGRLCGGCGLEGHTWENAGQGTPWVEWVSLKTLTYFFLLHVKNIFERYRNMRKPYMQENWSTKKQLWQRAGPWTLAYLSLSFSICQMGLITPTFWVIQRARCIYITLFYKGELYLHYTVVARSLIIVRAQQVVTIIVLLLSSRSRIICSAGEERRGSARDSFPPSFWQLYFSFSWGNCHSPDYAILMGLPICWPQGAPVIQIWLITVPHSLHHSDWPKNWQEMRFGPIRILHWDLYMCMLGEKKLLYFSFQFAKLS